MYHFEHTNHGVHLNILLQNIYDLFLRACNMDQ